jgi:lysyl-tRNA synthetase class 1
MNMTGTSQPEIEALLTPEQQLTLKELAKNSWVYAQAAVILEHAHESIKNKGYILFETGYGPSGLPHIGTFGEVLRTSMVMHAVKEISGLAVKLFCVSDDMDGMRKIPSTIPNPEQYKAYMDLPLVNIPDPFGTAASFAHNMNARLCAFLDAFDFEYEFISSSQYYADGKFNDKLLEALRKYDEIMSVMLPTLREERQKTYSPFLPVCPRTGKVLQVAVIDRDITEGTISYIDPETRERITIPVTDGHCKLQWKPDLGMRWAAFDVDFEMYGKDHLVNGKIYSKICEILGGKIPTQMFYELFLDAEGEKISKSKGNGFTIDNWLSYAPKESLALFMYNNPQRAKKLHLDMVPQHVDDYFTHLSKYHAESNDIKRRSNPVYHIHLGNPPAQGLPDGISYSLLLNLVSACNTEDAEVIWGYIAKFTGKAAIELKQNNFLHTIVSGAQRYYRDFVEPNKAYRSATEIEATAIRDLITQIKAMTKAEVADAMAIQQKVYDTGKAHGFDPKDWFRTLYEVLLGASSGPRFGSFAALYGVEELSRLVEARLLQV